MEIISAWWGIEYNHHHRQLIMKDKGFNQIDKKDHLKKKKFKYTQTIKIKKFRENR